MVWWIALLVAALGLLLLAGQMWAGIHDPEPGDGSIEEKVLQVGWMSCSILVIGLLLVAAFA